MAVAIWIVVAVLKTGVRVFSSVLAWYAFCLVAPREAKIVAVWAGRVADKALCERDERRARRERNST